MVSEHETNTLWHFHRHHFSQIVNMAMSHRENSAIKVLCSQMKRMVNEENLH